MNIYILEHFIEYIKPELQILIVAENDLRHDRWLLRIGAYDETTIVPRGRRVAMLQKNDAVGKRKESSGADNRQYKKTNSGNDRQDARDVRGFMSTTVFAAPLHIDNQETSIDGADSTPAFDTEQRKFQEIAEEDDAELFDGCVTDIRHFLVFQR